MLNNVESNNESDASEQLVSDMLKKESVDSLLTKAGGWGPLQFKSFLFVILALQGTNLYVYNLAYFELLPRLLCTTDGIQYHE